MTADAKAAIRAMNAARDFPEGTCPAYLYEHGGNRKHMCAMRVPAWDGLDKVRAGDGLTAWCSACDCPTSADFGGVIRDGEIFCKDCNGASDA